MALNVVDMTPAIGAELIIDKADLLSGAHAEEIRTLVRQRGVVFVRGAHLEEAEQLKVSHSLGKVQEAGKEGLQNISLDKEISISADYLRGSFFWHIDGASDDMPNFAATLNPKKLTDPPASTYFANTYAAYDALPDAEKKQYDTLKVVHSLEASQRMVTPEPSYETIRIWQTHRPKKVHPLVWTHVDGRKSFLLGATADYVQDMSIEEGRALLTKLRDWATQPQFVYKHEWEYGDFLIWDNTGTMHRVDPYPVDSGRLLIRTTIDGEEQVA